ncbi:oligosaccharide repeat unit polymerase, partial [Bacillus cereus]|nr:oligosaccharide repeat unit polymerase [Bacillus cereus]
MKNREERKTKHIYWWLRPDILILLFIIPMYSFIYLFYRGKNMNSLTNYFDFSYFLIGLILLLIFSYGCFLGKKIKISKIKKYSSKGVSNITLDALAMVTIFSYFLWFHQILLNPMYLVGALTGQYSTYFFRDTISTLPGLTTFTQMGILYISLYCWIRFKEKNTLKLRMTVYFYLILLLTLFRVVVWSERLALIEIVIPIVLIFFVKKLNRVKLFNLLPVFGISALVVLFTITEYFRSWHFRKYTVNQSIWEYCTDRILLYYSTAINNGVGRIENYGVLSGRFMENLLAPIYNIPYISNLFPDNVFNVTNADFLNAYADLEFNNPSGLFMILYDTGYIGSLLYVLLIGVITGNLYSRFINDNLLGVMLYPIFY